MLAIFVRHEKRLNTFKNRVLLVSAGMFFMLCGLTHVYSTFHETKSTVLSSLCAVVSLVSAACCVTSYRELDDYLSLRVTTLDVVRDGLVQDLSAGYDLRGVFDGSRMIEGCERGNCISDPVAFVGELRNNSIIEISSCHYRVTNVLAHSVYVGSESSDALVEEDAVEPRYTVFGYDATADVHMANEQERINRVKMEMCTSTAHDVRTPLSCLGIVISCLQSMSEGSGQIDEYDRLLEEAFVNIEMINLIITQFMDIANMDAKEEIRPTVSSIDMATLKDRILMIGNRLKGEKVEFICIDRVPKSLFSDSEWIWQIVLNLVTNSANYTYTGYIRVLLRWEASTYLAIVVADTGIGVNDDDKSRIFERFVTKKSFGHDSHGLGLYSVKMKVEALRGAINVSDNPGGGSVFEVRIPVTVDSMENSGLLPSSSVMKTCLIINDTPLIRKMMTRLLKDHDVHTAENGYEGLISMQSAHYDLVLLDMFMPVMDGLECITRFREWESENRDTRQTIYSMSANQHTVDDRFDGNLPKPIDRNRLSNLIERI